MTVRDLKDELEKYPEDYQVTVFVDNIGHCLIGRIEVDAESQLLDLDPACGSDRSLQPVTFNKS